MIAGNNSVGAAVSAAAVAAARSASLSQIFVSSKHLQQCRRGRKQRQGNFGDDLVVSTRNYGAWAYAFAACCRLWRQWVLSSVCLHHQGNLAIHIMHSVIHLYCMIGIINLHRHQLFGVYCSAAPAHAGSCFQQASPDSSARPGSG